MAYKKKTWECGETITADALNHMEDGIAEASQGGGRIVHVVGMGSCEGTPYAEVDISYSDVVEIIADGTPLWIDVPSGEHCGVLSLQAGMTDNDVYRVDAYILAESQITLFRLYSDTEDGNMRNANCWDK